MSRFSAPVTRFYVYRALVAEGFVYPIITIYALAQGLTLAVIVLLGIRARSDPFTERPPNEQTG